MPIISGGINQVRLRGGLGVLTAAVSDISKYVEQLSIATQKIQQQLQRCGTEQRGNTFTRACNEVNEIARMTSSVAEDLYQLQREVIDYQRRIARYEGRSAETANPVRPSIVCKTAPVAGCDVSIDVQVMQQILGAMREHVVSLDTTQIKMMNKVRTLGNSWNDPQYQRGFLPYFEQVGKKLEKAKSAFMAFNEELAKKIIEILTGG